MKKILVIMILLVLTVSLVMAQDVGPDAASTGITTAQQALKEVSVNKFEHAGFWYGSFPADQGLMVLRGFDGSPLDKEVIQDEVDAGIVTVETIQDDDYPDGQRTIINGDTRVLGAKAYFFQRGVITFGILPQRPIPIEGITKTVSVWVAGRNTNHRLELIVTDQFGNECYIDMGKLNFMGWKKLTVTIPPTVRQRDYHYINKQGISILGFNVNCALDETYGNFFIYLDDLRAVTDLFSEESRDLDDMPDTW